VEVGGRHRPFEGVEAGTSCVRLTIEVVVDEDVDEGVGRVAGPKKREVPFDHHVRSDHS
jgi:hypothetical protein